MKNLFSILRIILLSCAVVLPSQAAKPAVVDVSSCTDAPPAPPQLMRATGDNGAWLFTIKPAGGRFIDAESWAFNTTELKNAAKDADGNVTIAGWGTVKEVGNYTLSWTPAATTAGTFTVKVSFGFTCGTPQPNINLPDPNLPKATTVTWSGVVGDTVIELASMTFGGGKHALRSDAPQNRTFASNGAFAVPVPEVQKTAGTGIGSNPPVPLAYNITSPVCYTWESKISVTAHFNMSLGYWVSRC